MIFVRFYTIIILLFISNSTTVFGFINIRFNQLISNIQINKQNNYDILKRKINLNKHYNAVWGNNAYIILQDTIPKWYALKVGKAVEYVFKDNIEKELKTLEPLKYKDVFEVIVPMIKYANSKGNETYYSFKKKPGNIVFIKLILGPTTYDLIKRNRFVKDFMGNDDGNDNANRYSSASARKGFTCPVALSQQDVENLLYDHYEIRYLKENLHIKPKIMNGEFKIGDYVEILEFPFKGVRGFIKGIRNDDVLVRIYHYDEFDQKEIDNLYSNYTHLTALGKVTREEIEKEKLLNSDIKFPEEIMETKKNINKLIRPYITKNRLNERRKMLEGETPERITYDFNKKVEKEYKGPKLHIEAECERREKIALELFFKECKLENERLDNHLNKYRRFGLGDKSYKLKYGADVSIPRSLTSSTFNGTIFEEHDDENDENGDENDKNDDVNDDKNGDNDDNSSSLKKTMKKKKNIIKDPNKVLRQNPEFIKAQKHFKQLTVRELNAISNKLGIAPRDVITKKQRKGKLKHKTKFFPSRPLTPGLND